MLLSIEEAGDGALAPIIVEVDRGLFAEEIVVRTCYWLAGEADAVLKRDGDRLLVHLSAVRDSDREGLRTRFERGLIDFSLRADIERRTAGLRDLIWKTAFFEAGADRG
jgi:His-Xaa-Ser system protein HxsD